MKKKTIADKLAKKSFESAAFQKSWQVHMQAFGPILGPAFPTDYQAKVHLAAALNKLSGRDIQGALEKLKMVQKCCETDADKAAWSYFTGLCFEMAGQHQRMQELYMMAGDFGHSFYLPYLKLAKNAHQSGVYDIAARYYRQGISCLDANASDGQTKTVLASAWCNFGTCLTMMHEFNEAQEALEKSKKYGESLPGRSATEAVLCAARGQKEQTEALLAAVERENPDLAAKTRQETEKILAGKHPHFHVLPFETESLDSFWNWFEGQRSELEEKISRKEYDAVIAALNEALRPLAPFMDREPEFGIMPMEGKCRLELADFYVVSLCAVYEELIRRMPEGLKETWEITIIH